MRETKSNKAKRQRLQQPALSLVVCPEKDRDKRRCDDQVEPPYPPPNWVGQQIQNEAAGSCSAADGGGARASFDGGMETVGFRMGSRCSPGWAPQRVKNFR